MKIVLKIIHQGCSIQTYKCLSDNKKNKVKLCSLINKTRNWELSDKDIYNGFEVKVFENDLERKYCFDTSLPANFDSFLYEMKSTSKEE